MRRLFPFVLAGALAILPVFSQAAYTQAAPTKTLLTADVVINGWNVNPDKIADYEGVIAKLKESLLKLGRKDQAAGWKIMKIEKPQADGSIQYVHLITPVIRDADYSITNIVYEAFPDPTERTNFYNTYRGAIKGAAFGLQGSLAADLGK